MQPDVTTEEGRRELLLNTMGSFALDGMQPSAQTLGFAADYIEGRLSPPEIIVKVKAQYGGA